MCCTLVCSIFAQTQTHSPGEMVTVSGIVTDAADNSPLPGVAVLESGGKASAITTIDGQYTIRIPVGATIEFNCLGMVTKTHIVTEEGTLNITMSQEARVLDDVIVVAYGTSKKESFTGSAEVVSSEKLKDRPATDVTKMLDGQVAGVMSTSGSGQPGSGSDIRIRGFGSINASSSPLVVVDGVPFDGNLNSINSNDIANISVLKDASAGALYGARGANGVILVTTKRSKETEDKINISLSAKAGVVGRAIPAYNTVNAREYMEHMYEATYNDLVFIEGNLPSAASAKTVSTLASSILGTDGIYNIFDKNIGELFTADGKIVSDAGKKWNENWMDEAEADLPTRQEYQFSMNGASSKGKYQASISYLDEKGTLKTTGFKRFTGRIGADFTPKEWITYGGNISYANTRSDFLGSTGTTNTNVWYSAMMMAPIYPVYKHSADGSPVFDVNGDKVFDYGQSRPAGAQNNKNSVATLFDDDYYTKTSSISARGYLGLHWKDFSFTTNIGLDDTSSWQTTKYNRHNGNAAGTGRLTKENYRTLSYTWNQLLTWKKSFTDHNFDVMAGHEFYKYSLNYLVAGRTGFAFDNYDELAMGSTLAEGTSASDNYAIDSYLFRVNYDFSDKYYFSASARTDASSRFHKDHRWGLFWSAGASWRISEEGFLKDTSWINNLTLKASYGVQGNDNLNTYYAWQAFYDMNYPNASNSGAIITSIENPEVTWEKNGNFNVGVEFRFLDKIYGTLEWYSRKTSDMLLEYPMAISLGFPGYNTNIGSIRNNGIDLTIGADIIAKKDLRWNVSLIASTLSNKVLKLTGNGGDDIVSGVYMIREGEEINSFYMAKSAGVDPATGEQLYWAYSKDSDGNMISGSEYITNSTTAASSSKYLLGSRIPDIYGSFNTGLRVKNFDFSALLTYSLGGKIFDTVYYNLMEPTYVGQTYHKNALRSWSSAGDITDVPRATASSDGIISDRFLVDASYLSIKNLTLGYTLPTRVLSKAKINSLRVYLSAESPFIFTHLKGMNPQASFSGSTSYSYTPNKSLTLGVDINF